MPRTTDQQRAHDAARKSRRHPVRPKAQPEVIVLARRRPQEPPEPADDPTPAPGPETQPARRRDVRAEVLGDMAEERRRWR